jgi:hypothetical protein
MRSGAKGRGVEWAANGISQASVPRSWHTRIGALRTQPAFTTYRAVQSMGSDAPANSRYRRIVLAT